MEPVARQPPQTPGCHDAEGGLPPLTSTWGWTSLQPSAPSTQSSHFPHWSSSDDIVYARRSPSVYSDFPSWKKVFAVAISTFYFCNVYHRLSFLNSCSGNQAPSLLRQPSYLWEYSVLLHVQHVHCNTFSFYLRFGPGSNFPISSSLLCVCHNTLCVWFEKLTCSFLLTLIWYFMLQCRLLLMTRVVTHEVHSGPEPPTRTLIVFIHFCAIWMCVLQVCFFSRLSLTSYSLATNRENYFSLSTFWGLHTNPANGFGFVFICDSTLLPTKTFTT